MVTSNVNLVLAPGKSVVTSAGQGDVLSGMAVLRVKQSANTLTTGNDGVNPSESFSKTSELSTVITARGGT